MIRTVRNLGRLFVILWTLARHDALFLQELGESLPGLALLGRLLTRRGVKGRRGQRLAAALTETALGQTMGVLAVALAAVNVFGGFLVTRRMLEMFRKKDKKAAATGSAE